MFFKAKKSMGKIIKPIRKNNLENIWRIKN